MTKFSASQAKLNEVWAQGTLGPRAAEEPGGGEGDLQLVKAKGLTD